MEKIDFFGKQIFHEINGFEHDEDLIRAASACIEIHRSEEVKKMESHFQSDPDAHNKVSEEALEEILRLGKDVHGIATNPEISNCLKFNVDGIQDSFKNESIRLLRGRLDKVVFTKVRKLFDVNHELLVNNSGHFLYPPGGFMGWHTNSQYPGWRLYINYAEIPGKSFFRYLDPESGKIVTSWDKQWNFRLFKIDPKRPFWHAVYSEMNRYSFGFRITLSKRPPFLKRAVNHIKQLTKGSPLAQLRA